MFRLPFAWGLAVTLLIARSGLASEVAYFCSEQPNPGPVALSMGLAAKGSIVSAVPFLDSKSARVLPLRHAERCLNWGTPRLVEALHRAADAVRKVLPNSPPLGVGDLSRARGGPLPFSRSHQSGRDADLAFYQVDEWNAPVPAEDLHTFNWQGRAGSRRFDATRTWILVKALLEDPKIDVQWMFISRPLRNLLLQEARRRQESTSLLARAEAVLHQPTDSLPHADHIHLRIRCTEEERANGCRG